MKVKYVYKNKRTNQIRFSNEQLCDADYDLLDVLGWTREKSIYGEEIYEGDIAKDQNGNIYYIEYSNTVCGNLSFPSLCLFNVLEQIKIPLLINNNEDKFEIIGNRYNNIFPNTKKEIIEFARRYLEPSTIFRSDLKDNIEEKENALYVFDTSYGIDYDILDRINKGIVLLFTSSKLDSRMKEYIKIHGGVCTLETIYNKMWLIKL